MQHQTAYISIKLAASFTVFHVECFAWCLLSSFAFLMMLHEVQYCFGSGSRRLDYFAFSRVIFLPFQSLCFVWFNRFSSSLNSWNILYVGIRKKRIRILRIKWKEIRWGRNEEINPSGLKKSENVLFFAHSMK
jgi:hypothetical protein